MTNGRRGPLPLAAALAAAVGLAVASLQGAPVRGLTQGPALARAYDLLYDAAWVDAEAELTRACVSAPPVACEVIRTAGLWWRIALDIDNRSLDGQFLTWVNTAAAHGEQWVAREPERAEAWFYLGAAYGARVNYHAQRAEYFAAARDGKRIKVSLEKALALDPTLHDANFGIGLYEYYADIAPAVLKLVRWLLALPGGDRVRGLERMVKARDQGTLVRADAAYQLQQIYLWYEKQPDRALTLLEELHTKYPHNPVFLRDIASVHVEYRNDRPAALAVYRALIDGARAGTLHEAGLADAWGHMGAAAQLDALGDTDRAIDDWRAVADRRPAAPYGVAARAWLEIGRASDRLGWRAQATAAYRAAIGAVPPGDPRGVRGAAQSGLSHTPDRSTADAARLSLEGWRAFERGALDDARGRLDLSLRLRPDDGAARYRRGRVLAAQRDRAGAEADFARALQTNPAPTFIAASYLELGRLAEAAGDRARAVRHYESAARTRGALPETRDGAQLAIARLH
jgi:tetratricopeptide (TPR) repeat protein